MRRYLHCLFVLFVFSSVVGFSQQRDSGGLITGYIRDEESGNVLENVAIFLPFSSIGTSSGADGRFRLSRLPAGRFDLVVQRVGFEQQVIPVSVERSDSLYLDIRLRAKAILVKEVEVLGERAPTLSIQPLFFPRDTTGVICIYGTSNSLPIGILTTDSALYLYALETIVIDSQKYLRFWMLYKNSSASEYEFDPMKRLTLRMISKKGSDRIIHPDPPSRIVSKVDRNDAIASISETIKRDLESLAKKQTMHTYEESVFKMLLILRQLRPRRSYEPQQFAPAEEGSLSSSMYHTFISSVNVGILNSYRVFPENSLNGYAYFPFPGMQWKTSGTAFAESMNYTYMLSITTPTGVKTIEFIPR